MWNKLGCSSLQFKYWWSFYQNWVQYLLINALELLVGFLGLKIFVKASNKQVKTLSDNITAVYVILIKLDQTILKYAEGLYVNMELVTTKGSSPTFVSNIKRI